MKHRYVHRASQLSSTGGSAFVTQGISLGVRKDTRKKYASSYRKYIGYCVRKGRTYGLRSFERYLHACRKLGAAGQTLEGYRSAVLWAQRLSGSEAWAADDRLVRAIAGYEYEDRLTRVPRGAITRPMFGQLMDHDKKHGVLYAAVFFGILRKSQARRMRFGDAHIGEDGSMTLTVRSDKRVRRGVVNEATHVKPILYPAAIEFFRVLMTKGKHGELVFPKFDDKAASEAIKAAAVAFSWPSGVDYDGLHGLRHGGAQELKAFLCLIAGQMGAPAAMSRRTQEHYTRLNIERIIRKCDDLSDSDADPDEPAPPVASRRGGGGRKKKRSE